jgi:hypothetical protein
VRSQPNPYRQHALAPAFCEPTIDADCTSGNATDWQGRGCAYRRNAAKSSPVPAGPRHRKPHRDVSSPARIRQHRAWRGVWSAALTAWAGERRGTHRGPARGGPLAALSSRGSVSPRPCSTGSVAKPPACCRLPRRASARHDRRETTASRLGAKRPPTRYMRVGGRLGLRPPSAVA